jgi:hypothetical protein
VTKVDETCLHDGRSGSYCDADSDCPGGFCHDSVSEQRVCFGGTYAWQACSGADPCPEGTCPQRVCDGGSNNGQSCFADYDCPSGTCPFKVCVDGPNNGQACYTDDPCPAGTCSDRQCVGGANAGNWCTTDTDCPSGSCRKLTVPANFQLQDNRARHYDPHHGGWLQRDPLGTTPTANVGSVLQLTKKISGSVVPRRQYNPGNNLYEYVRSSPPRTDDPTGLVGRWTCPSHSSCGNPIADGRAVWFLHKSPFVLFEQDLELPTPESGWLGPIFGTAGELGAWSITSEVPIGQIGWKVIQNTLHPLKPWEIADRYLCYCRFFLHQECKQCVTTAHDLGSGAYTFTRGWQSKKFVCRLAYTSEVLQLAGSPDAYVFKCPCRGPNGDEPGLVFLLVGPSQTNHAGVARKNVTRRAARGGGKYDRTNEYLVCLRSTDSWRTSCGSLDIGAFL